MLCQDGVVHNPLSIRVNKNRLAEHGIVGLYLATPKTVTGTTWKDLSLNRNDGTWTSADWRSNGLRGTDRTGGIRHCNFDGTAGYVTLGQPASLNFVPRTNAFSILVVFRHPNVAPVANEMLIGRGNAGTIQYIFNLNQTTGTVGAISANIGGSSSTGSTNTADGKWHVGIVSVPAASSGLLLYTDGIQESFSAGTGLISLSTVALDTLIGARRNASNADAAKFFGGSLDCIMFFNRALNAAEAKYWTNAVKTGLTGIVRYQRGWQLNLVSNIPLALMGAAESQSFSYPQWGIARVLSSQEISQSYSNANEKFLRPLSSQEESQSYSNANDKIARALSAQEESQSYSNANDKIARALSSQEESQSYSNANNKIARALSSQEVSQSFSNANEKFLRPLSSQEESQSFAWTDEAVAKQLFGSAFCSQSFATGNEKVLRPLSSQEISQSYSNANEKFLRALSAKEISQSSSYGATGATIYLYATSASQSFSNANSKITRALYSQQLSQSYAYTDEYITKQFFGSAFCSQSFATGNEKVARQLSSLAESESSANANEIIQRALSSIETVSQSLAWGKFTEILAALPYGCVSQSYAWANGWVNAPSTIALAGSVISQSFAIGVEAYLGNKFVELTRAAPIVAEDAINVGPIEILEEETAISLRRYGEQQVIISGQVDDDGK